MILKYSVLRETGPSSANVPKTVDGGRDLYRAWNWVGELTRIQGFGINYDPDVQWENFADCDWVADEKSLDEGHKPGPWQVYWLYRKDGKIAYLAFPCYTEAYLLADDGSTVDRVN